MASPVSNEQEDYGGDLVARLGFVTAIIKKIQPFASDDFVISYRMGSNADSAFAIQTTRELKYSGVELLHASSGIPVIVVNGIRTMERGNVLLENNQYDFVACGRPFLAESD